MSGAARTKGSSDPARGVRRQHLLPWMAVALLLVVTSAVYARVVGYEFVLLDDNRYVSEEPRVLAGLTGSGVIWALTSTTVENWHPLTWLSYMLDAQVFGSDPGGFHLTNLLLHLANTWLLFAVLNRMTGAAWRSLLVAALFALHPLRVESVAWVSERKDVLSGLFFMVTLWCYARYAERPAPGRYVAVLLAFGAGLMAKPMLVTVPLVLLLLDYWPLRRTQLGESDLDLRSVPRLLLEKAPLLLMSAASCAVTVLVHLKSGSLIALQRVPFDQRLTNAAVAYVDYVRKSFWPAGLAAYYPHPEESTPIVLALGATLLILVIALLALRARRSSPWLVVGWLWFVGMLFPVIGIVQVGRQAMADRYSYLPSIGLFLALTWMISTLVGQRRKLRSLLVALSLATISALALTSWIQVGHWKNTITLFEHTLSVTSNNALIHYYLGTSLDREGRSEEAIAELERALAINPQFVAIHSDLAGLLVRARRPLEALTHYEAAVAILPDSGMARYNLGTHLYQIGRVDQAIGQLSEAVRLDPERSPSHTNLGNALLQRGRAEEAIAHHRAAVQIAPADGIARFSLGSALASVGEFREAEHHLGQVVRLQPEFLEARLRFAGVLAEQARTDEAIAELNELFRMAPDHPGVRSSLERLRVLRDSEP
jgi:tetratricopeptide (TPR) repeat protein